MTGKRASLITTVLLAALLIFSLSSCSSYVRLTDELFITDIDIDGSLSYSYWNEISVPANGMGLLPGEEPLASNFQSGFAYFFADEAIPANEKYVHFTVTMPHDYKEGTNVIFNIRWAFRNDEVGTYVRWRLSTSWANIGDAFPVATNAWALSNPSNNDNSIYQRTAFAPTSGIGKEISSQILCYLQRNSSNASDNYTDVAVFLSVGVLYQQDEPGSINPWSK
jgi:hypothetical protein